jgi:hypothetical protein
LILGISEELFWNIDISFLVSVEINKNAYDSWLNYAREEMMNNGKK